MPRGGAELHTLPSIRTRRAKVEKREPKNKWTFRLWVSRIGGVFVAIADSILGNFRR
jgi:hypothetical protein